MDYNWLTPKAQARPAGDKGWGSFAIERIAQGETVAALGGRVAYAVGYTGLGTASSRFGALAMLDLLARRKTERTELAIVKRKPFPFPPEPIRYPLVQFTRSQLAKEDRTGKRGLWLRILDFFGLGFNS